MEIKHIHPPHTSAEKRAESLKDAYRTCLARIAASRNKQTRCEKQGA